MKPLIRKEWEAGLKPLADRCERKDLRKQAKKTLAPGGGRRDSKFHQVKGNLGGRGATCTMGDAHRRRGGRTGDRRTIRFSTERGGQTDDTDTGAARGAAQRSITATGRRPRGAPPSWFHAARDEHRVLVRTTAWDCGAARRIEFTRGVPELTSSRPTSWPWAPARRPSSPFRTRGAKGELGE